MMRWLPFLFAAIAMADTAPIADENLRMNVLHAIFPGMQITLVPGKRINDSPAKKPGPYELDSPDALAKENVYRVIGQATNHVERCASEDLQVSGKFSDTRVLRFQLFGWPKSTAMLAVLQYNFEGANPAGSCWSVGLLVRLDEWKVGDQYLLDTQHHTALLSVRLVDLTGGGIDELVVEPDMGGAGTWGSNLLVFDLTQPKFQEVFETTSRISYMTDDMYEQVLDVPQTVLRHGTRYCFVKTTMIEAEEAFRPPRVSKPCYKPDEYGDHTESDERNKMLAPFSKP